jgi:hypothetical protein
LWKIVKPLVRTVESPEATISIDDSISEKPYTDENDIIAWHWSHTFERHVKGLEFLTAYYQVEGVSLPIAFDIVEKTEQYVDPKTKKAKRRSPVTKNQRYLTGRDRRQIAWINQRHITGENLDEAITTMINGYNQFRLPGLCGGLSRRHEVGLVRIEPAVGIPHPLRRVRRDWVLSHLR